jgi:hypothetical protein
MEIGAKRAELRGFLKNLIAHVNARTRELFQQNQ